MDYGRQYRLSALEVTSLLGLCASCDDSLLVPENPAYFGRNFVIHLTCPGCGVSTLSRIELTERGATIQSLLLDLSTIDEAARFHDGRTVDEDDVLAVVSALRSDSFPITNKPLAVRPGVC